MRCYRNWLETTTNGTGCDKNKADDANDAQHQHNIEHAGVPLRVLFFHRGPRCNNCLSLPGYNVGNWERLKMTLVCTGDDVSDH